MESATAASLPWPPIDGSAPAGILPSTTRASCRLFCNEESMPSASDARNRRAVLRQVSSWRRARPWMRLWSAKRSQNNSCEGLRTVGSNQLPYDHAPDEEDANRATADLLDAHQKLGDPACASGPVVHFYMGRVRYGSGLSKSFFTSTTPTPATPWPSSVMPADRARSLPQRLRNPAYMRPHRAWHLSSRRAPVVDRTRPAAIYIIDTGPPPL